MNSVRLFLLAVVAAAYINVYSADNMVPSGFRMLPQWSIGADFTGGYVFGTNSFLKGNNEEGRIINSTLAGVCVRDSVLIRIPVRVCSIKGFIRV